MKNRLIAFVLLGLGIGSFVSCVDPEQSQDVIFQQDKEAIENYIMVNPFIGAVKEYGLVDQAFYMFWDTSISEEINTSMRVSDTVTINYTGRLLTDVVFDSSIEQVAKDNGVYDSTRDYEPLTFPNGLGNFLSGFEFAISKMKAGEKATVIFPSGMGYVNQARPNIPPNSPLIFELELIRIKNGPNHE